MQPGTSLSSCLCMMFCNDMVEPKTSWNPLKSDASGNDSFDMFQVTDSHNIPMIYKYVPLDIPVYPQYIPMVVASVTIFHG